MKCPKCGSENLEVISDVKGKGASFWKLCFCGLLGPLRSRKNNNHSLLGMQKLWK